MCSTVIERRHREEQNCHCNTNDGTTSTGQPSQLDSSHLAYFMKKIHLQVVRSAMIPPSRGPSRFAKANTELTMPKDRCTKSVNVSVAVHTWILLARVEADLLGYNHLHDRDERQSIVARASNSLESPEHD
jgi:hypothetical protein